MSHLGLTLALLAALACSGSKPAEPPAEVPVAPATDPEAEGPDPAQPLSSAAEPEPTAPAQVQTLFVGPTLADCQGEAPQKCLQVRESPSEPYRNLYTPIAGFEYEPAYEYELRVEVTPVPAPADASALRYRLIEVVAKRKAPASAP